MKLESLPPQGWGLGSHRGAESKGPCVLAPRVPLRYALPGWLMGLFRFAALRNCPSMRVTRGSRRTDLAVFHHDKHRTPATCGGKLPKRKEFSATGRGQNLQLCRLRRPPVYPLAQPKGTKRVSFPPLRRRLFFARAKKSGGRKPALLSASPAPSGAHTAYM